MQTARRAAPLAILLLATATYLAWALPGAVEHARQAGSPDSICYMESARALRRLTYQTPGWSLFPPGYPLIVALLPAPVSWTSAVVASALMFLASVVLVYLLGLRETNETGAAIAAALWSGVALILPYDILAAMSESTFATLLLAVLVTRHPMLSGTFAGLAALTRIEGVLLLPVLAIRHGGWRSCARASLPFALLVLSYLLTAHAQTGRWELTSKARLNSQAAPYLAAGLTWGEVERLMVPGQRILPPDDPRTRRILGPRKQAQALATASPLARITPNAASAWQDGWFLFPFALFGCAGIAALAAAKRRLSLALVVLPIGLVWLPYFYAGSRFLLLPVLACCLGAAGLAELTRDRGCCKADD